MSKISDLYDIEKDLSEYYRFSNEELQINYYYYEYFHLTFISIIQQINQHYQTHRMMCI